MSYASRLNTIKEQVEGILRDHPEARNCDKELFIKYLEIYHSVQDYFSRNDYNGLQGMLKAAPSFESIRRMRQKLQEKGEYTADPQIQAGRRERRNDIYSYVTGGLF